MSAETTPTQAAGLNATALNNLGTTNLSSLTTTEVSELSITGLNGRAPIRHTVRHGLGRAIECRAHQTALAATQIGQPGAVVAGFHAS